LLEIAATTRRLLNSAACVAGALELSPASAFVISVKNHSPPSGCRRTPRRGQAWPRLPAPAAYALALLVSAVAFAAVSFIGDLLQAAPPVSLFLCAIIFVAWFAGFGPALFATALSTLAFGYFYLWPINSLTLASRDLPRIVLFGIAALFIAAVSAAQRRTEASLRRARDQLQGAVSDLEALNVELRRENAEREAAEAALRKSEAYLDHAQRLSRTGSFARHVGGTDIVWSKETYRIFGVEETVKPTRDFVMEHVPPEERERVRGELDRQAAAGDLEVEHAWLMPDGSRKLLHIRAQRVCYEGGEEELVGAVMDVTEARAQQEALAEAQAQLAHANRVATLGALAASIAHEVNQPLAAIVANGDANLHWLDRPAPDMAAVREGLAQMIADAERASNVVNRVRALARNKQPERIPLDLNAVIHDVVKLIGREIASHQVSLRLALAQNLPAVLGDRVELQQLIINLAINGIQAMAAIADRPRRLAIRSQRDEDGDVAVAIEDSGNGIDPANANRLFDAFYTTKAGGMGLGLSICRAIVEAHGGRISACNSAAGGAVFSFTLPTAARRAAVAAAAGSATH
jgi:signal transduction histidine kinase